MLKLLADENIPRLLIVRLRERGHDVQWILEDKQGIDDPAVLASARSQQRLLITADKDFGALIFRSGQSASVGVILLRVLGAKSQAELTEVVLPVLEAHQDAWFGRFSVIDRRSVRVRPLPPA